MQSLGISKISEINKDDEAKLTSLLMGGTGQIRTQSACNLCLEFANKDLDALIPNQPIRGCPKITFRTASGLYDIQLSIDRISL